MFDKEEKNEELGKLIEAISDDLFLIKLESKLIRIDDRNVDNFRTSFQRMFFCKRWLKNHIFWGGCDKGTVVKGDLEKESERQQRHRLQRGCKKGTVVKSDLEKEFLEGGKIFEWLIKKGHLHRISETEGRLKVDVQVIKDDLEQEYPIDSARIFDILQQSDKESINKVIDQLSSVPL